MEREFSSPHSGDPVPGQESARREPPTTQDLDARETGGRLELPRGSRLPTLRILYFAGLREALGVAEESVHLPSEIRTVGQLCAYLASRHRGYADRRTHVRVARNEVFACDDESVADGDVIALIPPVAGG